jgi:tRNA A-37 threonylcarbamoyl transferase component Bud32
MSGKKQKTSFHIDTFEFESGAVVAGKYKILERLGAGWEGEVYLIKETATGIERTAKFFYPQQNQRDKALKFYARKLHKLRQCHIVIQYHTQERTTFNDIPISFLVSEYVHGELLSEFLRRQPGKRLTPFQAVHLLHALAKGISCIHQKGEYHGDLHPENIIVERYGLTFELKLLDMFHWGKPSASNIRHDVVDLVRIFYDALGGQKKYAKQKEEMKNICCGLKRSLIAKKFRTAEQLRAYLELMNWN